MEIEITADQKVKLNKIVNMTKTDYKEYQKLLNSNISSRESNKKINEIANKYMFDHCDSQIEWDDPEETIFNIVKDI